MKEKLTLALLIAFAMPTLAPAQWPPGKVVSQRERELGTRGPSSGQAHEILEADKDRKFDYPTLVVGIEKASRKKIRLDSPGQYRSPEEKRLIARVDWPGFCPAPSGTCSAPRPSDRRCQLVEQQRCKLESYFDDGKRTFLSHLAYWDPASAVPRLLYNAYVDCRQGGGEAAGGFDCRKTAYDNSWEALERLQHAKLLSTESLAEKHITHIVVMSKGWNTAQGDSVDFFQEMPKLIGKAAADRGGEFRPLVIGVTWHSGWVWPLSKIPLLKVLPKVASYKNKAKDSDEIGAAWVNVLLNQVLRGAAERADVPLIVFGHSFGARLLTRAAASADLIAADDAKQISLLISLQGAFSMNRFLPQRCAGREGAPYADLTENVERMVLVWSGRDRTNPLAQLATGANHVGGKPGHRRALEYNDRYRFRKWGPGWMPARSERRKKGDRCFEQVPAVSPVELVDATSIVSSHGDIQHERMARLIWELIAEGES